MQWVLEIPLQEILLVRLAAETLAQILRVQAVLHAAAQSAREAGAAAAGEGKHLARRAADAAGEKVVRARNDVQHPRRLGGGSAGEAARIEGDRLRASAHVAAIAASAANDAEPLHGIVKHAVVFVGDVDRGAAHADGRDGGADLVGAVIRLAGDEAQRALDDIDVGGFRLVAVEHEFIEHDFRIGADGEHGVVDEMNVGRAVAGGDDAIVLLEEIVELQFLDGAPALIIRLRHGGNHIADGFGVGVRANKKRREEGGAGGEGAEGHHGR